MLRSHRCGELGESQVLGQAGASFGVFSSFDEPASFVSFASQIQDYEEGCILALVGTKLDLIESGTERAGMFALPAFDIDSLPSYLRCHFFVCSVTKRCAQLRSWYACCSCWLYLPLNFLCSVQKSGRTPSKRLR